MPAITDPDLLIDHLHSRAEQARSLLSLIQTARSVQVPTPTLDLLLVSTIRDTEATAAMSMAAMQIADALEAIDQEVRAEAKSISFDGSVGKAGATRPTSTLTGRMTRMHCRPTVFNP